MRRLSFTCSDALVATFSAPESAAWARLILREQQNPSEAFDRLYGGVIGAHAVADYEIDCASTRDVDPNAVETR